ncbi:MAG: hypothetical protein V1857_06060, partial [archaeon]
MSRNADPLIMEWANKKAFPVRSARKIERFCEFSHKTPSQLLEMEREAATKTVEQERFAVVRLVHNYIGSLKGRRSYKAV